MAILALNCGSSSLKFGLFQLDRGTTPGPRPVHGGQRFADGLVDRLFTGDTVSRIRIGNQVQETTGSGGSARADSTDV